MDKLSEYIPLIIIIATLIFSLIGKRKKQNTLVNEQDTIRESLEGLDTILELPQPTNGINNKIIEEKMKKKGFSNMEKTKKNIVIPSFSTDTVILDTEEEGINNSFSIEEEEDVIKAIVYSEIINKRDY